MTNMKRLWRNLYEMWTIYREYEIHKIYKPYTIYGIRNSIKMLKLYLDKENNA